MVKDMLASTCAVSIVIPMYNTKKYIGAGLDSILAQNFQDYEVIVVNDCSTDNSRAIAESYLEKFSGRLKIYDNEKNSGPSFSRNRGLLLSRGEYVFFMDADDMFIPTALEEMYALAKTFAPDVISFTIRCETSEDGKELDFERPAKPIVPDDKILIDDGEKLIVVDSDKPGLPERVKSLTNTLTWRAGILSQYVFRREVWLKLSKRSFLIEKNLLFNEDINFFEDHVWVYGIFLCAKKIIHVPRVLYHHRKSQDSLVRLKRSRLQKAILPLDAIVYGMKRIDNVMDSLDFFKENPAVRHSVLENFTQRYFKWILKHCPKVEQHDFYAAIKQNYGDKFGVYDVLISELITFANAKQKLAHKLSEELKTK